MRALLKYTDGEVIGEVDAVSMGDGRYVLYDGVLYERDGDCFVVDRVATTHSDGGES